MATPAVAVTPAAAANCGSLIYVHTNSGHHYFKCGQCNAFDDELAFFRSQHRTVVRKVEKAHQKIHDKLRSGETVKKRAVGGQAVVLKTGTEDAVA
eukprot:672464-Prymnesium_polylepis.1